MGASAVLCVGSKLPAAFQWAPNGRVTRTQKREQGQQQSVQLWARGDGKERQRRVVMARAEGAMDSFPGVSMRGPGGPGGIEQFARLQDLDPGTMLLQQRILFLGSQVDDFSADLIISQMLLLDAQDPTRDIKLFINSPGGSVTAGMGIYDAMKLCKADVSTVCFGLAASMGAFLLTAGTKGKRYCMPNARVMIHQPLGGAGGTAIDGALQVREMMFHKYKLQKIMSRLTGQPEARVEADTDRDNFMNAWEAMEYGLVDGVIGDGNPDLVAPIGSPIEPPKPKINSNWTIKEFRERRYMPSEDAAARQIEAPKS
ncbi:uncharacterized protein [Physcomitrium patens]|uniref:ATP-dependent Clp protease proteolytic subunit n=1 Tax=Physcomitrium patens TaxID=3218 RepID=A0A2K1J485_PHYPA|nr:ATP-dependent Clp protease proteolytic subunit 3, chloroplastic-like [Physcomitrium patens]PNR36344.1 hypothetical protein PHYPA_022195 [Physcomitrium patens]|eukprot:XP_024401321.1 ATP-dependent Clp protease proteolytic subunit 3, chloroplastic-like [Physcomitrella patens]